MEITTVTESKPATPVSSNEDRLIALISPLVAPLGYEIVHIEALNQRQKVLRIFIDYAGSMVSSQGDQGIGIADCVKVTKALDEPLDAISEIEGIFHGAYELEVSSPGVDRPLRNEMDYNRFSGRDVRIHVFRPLSADEIQNSDYQARNPKQKNFQGQLKGVRNGKVLLALNAEKSGRSEGKKERKKKDKTPSDKTNSVEEVFIPLPLISKANLEPNFEFDE